MDHLSYDIRIFLNIYNLDKTKYLKIKSTVTLWLYGEAVDSTIISPISLNGTVSQNITLNLFKKNAHFSLERYIPTKHINMYLHFKLDITAHSAIRPSKISTYTLKAGCQIVMTKAVLAEYR